MFARFYRQLAPHQVTLSGLSGTAQFLIRWVSMSRRACGESALQVLERVPLTPHTSVALIRFGSEDLVLGVTPQNITVLARREAIEVAGNTQSVES